MPPSDPAERALAAVLSGPPSAVLIAEDAAGYVQVHGTCLAEPALARQLVRDGAEVVVVHNPGPSLARALRERPPTLLVITGPVAHEPGFPATLILGPDARLGIAATGTTIACATNPSELAILLEALRNHSPTSPRVSACPTPSWWPRWLGSADLAGTTAVGFVAATVLDPTWVHWARAAQAQHVVVPLGLTPPRIDTPHDPSLATAVAAHALERWTGPVFPSPQVVALLHRSPAATPSPEPEATPHALAVWAQARRALALVGAAPGMQAPQVGLSLASPTAAFIAQRSQLRRLQTQALLADLPDLSIDLDPVAVARAGEVLRGAGQVLSEHESKVVLRGFGVEITRQAVASSASGAAQYAETIGYPVVLKAVSPDLRRKQELGVVHLGLTTGAAVRRAYAAILHNVEQHAPTAHLDGVLVAEQAPDGLELHCGAVRLHTGDVALFGRALGLSVPAENCLALAPLDPAEAILFAHAILSRVPVPALRRASDPGVAELAALLLRIDALVQHFDAELPGRIVSVELSPVRLIGPPRGYLTLDARIVQRAHLDGT